MGKDGIKVTDEMFLAFLRENAGLFARTARAISKHIGAPFSRQAVRERALKHPDVLEDIDEENGDVAEEGLHSLMRSRKETIKLDAVKFYLKTKGKKRGYIEKSEIDHTTKGDKIEPTTNVFNITGSELDDQLHNRLSKGSDVK